MAPPPWSKLETDPHATYMGEEVSQSFLDLITRVYQEQHEAAHETHAEAPGDAVAQVAVMEAAGVTGAPEACALAREHAVNPPVAP